MEISLKEFLDELAKPGVRCALQVRHGERPRIQADDPTFGDALALTEEGQRTARLLGEALSAFRDDVTFWSSPLRRTTMTAELIAAGMGVDGAAIPTDGRIGNETFYFADPAEVLDVFRPENFFNACFEYYRVGEMRGFHNLHEASDKLESWLLARLEKKLLVATTHDCYIAAKGGMEFSRDNWPRFLDGGATFVYPDASKKHVLVRTGFSQGICGVGGKVM